MTQLAEKLIILADLADGLLVRTHRLLTFKTPDSVANQSLRDVRKKMVAKFPVFDDSVFKAKGFAIFEQLASSIADDLRGFYMTALDVFEFRKSALALLQEINKEWIFIDFLKSPGLFARYMDLVTGYGRIHLLLSRVDFKQHLYCYAVAFKVNNQRVEPSFEQVGQFLTTLTNDPFKFLHREMKGAGGRVGAAIGTIMEHIYGTLLPTQIQKELSLLESVEHLPRPATPKELITFLMVQDSAKIKDWILWGNLLFPTQLPKPGMKDLVGTMLGRGYCQLLYREQTIDLHEVLDNCISAKHTKELRLKKKPLNYQDILKESSRKAVEESGWDHAKFRKLAHTLLSNAVHLFADNPGCIAPKIQYIFALLAFGQREIEWYFRHLDEPPIKSSGKHPPSAFQDERISTLIHLVFALRGLVTQYKDIVVQYHIEFMALEAQAVQGPLDQICSAAGIDPRAVQALQIVKTEMTRASGFTPSTVTSLEKLRINWMRANGAFVRQSKNSEIGPIQTHVNAAVRHSLIIDRFDTTLSTYSSLKGLWFILKSKVFKTFKYSIRGASPLPSHALDYVRLLDCGLDNVHRQAPEEQEEIGKDALHHAESMINSVINLLLQLVELIQGSCQQLSEKLGDSDAFLSLQMKHDYKIQVSQRKKVGDFVEKPLPGTESMFSQAYGKFNKDLRRWDRNVADLCRAFKSNDSIQVFTKVIHPNSFLYKALSKQLRDKLRALTRGNKGPGIERPTLLLGKIQSLLASYQRIDSHVHINVGDIIRTVMYAEFSDRTVGSCGLDLNSGEARQEDADAGDSCITILTNWMCERVKTDHLAQRGVLFSGFVNAFVTHTQGLPPPRKDQPQFIDFPLENYIEFQEVRAFCQLTGPSGVRALDSIVLKEFSEHIRTIKRVLMANESVLVDADLSDKFAWTRVRDGLKDMEHLMSAGVSAGLLLEFRKLVHSALENVVSDSCPFVFQAVQHAHGLGVTDATLENLIVDCGLAKLNQDSRLLNVVRGHNENATDNALFARLPELLGLAFTAPQWQNARYVSKLEALSNNGHCFARLAATLVTSTAVTNKTPISPQELRLRLESVVQFSASSILHLGEEGPGRARAMALFLEYFIDATPLVDMALLESCLPFSILRESYINLTEAGMRNSKYRSLIS